MLPFRFFVPSTLRTILGLLKECVGILYWEINEGEMKFSVAPLSISAHALAATFEVNICTLALIDHCFGTNASPGKIALIMAT